MHLQAVYLAGYYQFLLESIEACFASNHIIQNGKCWLVYPEQWWFVEKSKRIDFPLVQIYDMDVSSLWVLKFNFAGRRLSMNLFDCTFKLDVCKIYNTIVKYRYFWRFLNWAIQYTRFLWNKIDYFNELTCGLK